MARPLLAAALLFAPLAACEPELAPKPLPPLIVPPPPVAAQTDDLWIVPGEHLMWDVIANGVSIGQAEMKVEETSIESRFATNGLARMFAADDEQLTTPIVRGARELDVHAALAWLRAWAPRATAPAELEVAFAGDHYHVACDAPLADELHGARVRRVACEVAGKDPISIVLQLSDDRDRVPVRVVARAGSLRLEAELVSRDQRGDGATGVPPAHAAAR